MDRALFFAAAWRVATSNAECYRRGGSRSHYRWGWARGSGPSGFPRINLHRQLLAHLLQDFLQGSGFFDVGGDLFADGAAHHICVE